MKSIPLLRKLITRNLTREKCIWFVCLLLLGIWALIPIPLKYKICGILVIAFFLIPASFYLLRYMVLTLLTLFIVVFNTTAIATLETVILTNLTTVQNLENQITEMVSPNSGLPEGLPSEDWQMISLMQANHLPNYRLSNQIFQEPLIRQRIIEAAWPIKMDNGSVYLFMENKETDNDSNCNIIDRREDVVLEYCH